MKTLKLEYPSVKNWGALGFCWGGKIVALTSGKNTPFAASIQTSPARLDADDASKIIIPTAILASKGEDVTAVQQYKENLKVGHHVEIFDSQVHGWMSARGDLKDTAVKAEYERGYKTVLDFFGTHL